MVGDLLVVDITCLCDRLVVSRIKHIRCKFLDRGKIAKSADITVNLLCNRCGEHAGIRSRIDDELFLIKFLYNLERLIRTDLKHLGTIVLKLRKVVEKRRILRLLLLFNFDEMCLDSSSVFSTG